MGIVSRVQLRDFRNIPALETEFSPGITIITGANGQGKTSLLEGIYYLAFLRSFRTRRPTDMTRWGAAGWTIKASVTPSSAAVGGLSTHSLAVSYTDSKRLIRDEKIIHDGMEFINSFLCVALVPEDLDLIKGPPLLRRRFVDMLLCQISRDYLHGLVRYNQALTRRNALLKNVGRFGEKAVRAYDPILAETGARLTWTRASVLSELAAVYSDVLGELTDTPAAWTSRYVSSVFRRQSEGMSIDELKQGMLTCLENEFSRDEERRVTRFGPHRDDLSITINGKSLSTYGSEGQCRLGALGLRLAAMRMLKETLANSEVVLLVDDVFGELDTHRRAAFFNTVSQADQVFITGTSIPSELTDFSRRMIMVDGCLSGESS
ncbi:MAG: DNA replication and repair protein RecF [Lentisphaeria bacterium]|nr:DNA replication and repair protein RecF [Lentisphaeria bacterium]